MCCKISLFKTTLLEPLLQDPEKEVIVSNLRPLEEAVVKFYGDDFQKHLSQCQEHSLLTERQICDAKKHMYTYLQTLGKALEIWFPELKFMIKNFSFIDLPQRKLGIDKLC